MMKQIAESNMIIIIGLILYLISFLLPAYSVNSKLFYGYECAYIAPVIAVSEDVEGGMLVKILTRIHIFLLGLHNVLLPLSLLLFKNKLDMKYPWVMHSCMFSVLNTILFFFYSHFELSVANEELLVGYYIWVLSGLMILTAQNWKRKILVQIAGG